MTDGKTDRVPYITAREDVPAEHHGHFDHIAETRGGVRGPFSVLMNSPAVAGRVGRLGTYVRFEGILGDRERELAILVTAREFESAYEWAVHEPIARRAGVSDDAIEAVAVANSTDDIPNDEALIVEYGRSLFRRNGIPDSRFERAKEHFTDQELTELSTTFGYYAMLACVLNAFDVVPETNSPRWS
jgi:4-carboxymuconolactone decarboxylase